MKVFSLSLAKMISFMACSTAFVVGCGSETSTRRKDNQVATASTGESVALAANVEKRVSARYRMASLPKPNVAVHGSMLVVDGKPYTIRGVCYNPRRFGKTHHDAGSFIYQDASTEDYDQIWMDLEKMQKANINTVRVYQAITDPYVLEMFHVKGIKIIQNVIISATETPVSIMNDTSSLGQTIKMLSNHPTTLMLEIGNEWTLNKFYMDSWTYNQAQDYLITASHYVRGLSRIPITSSMSGLAWYLKSDPEVSWLLNAHEFQVDVWGMNVYDSFDHVDGLMTKYAQLTGKPFYLSEFGADRWDARGAGHNPLMAAAAAGAYIDKVIGHLEIINPGKRGIGGTIFSFADEYGRNDGRNPWAQEALPGGPGHEPIYADGKFDEEYFGLLSRDRHTEFEAYKTVQQRYELIRNMTAR